MINRVLLFLSILLMINVVLVGFGIYDQSLLLSEQYTVINKDVTNIDNLSTTTDIQLVDVGESDSVFDSSDSIKLVPEATQAYKGMKTILKVAGGMVFGWSAVFIVLGFPAILTYGLTIIIGLIQVMSIFYLINYFIASLRGGL